MVIQIVIGLGLMANIRQVCKACPLFACNNRGKPKQLPYQNLYQERDIPCGRLDPHATMWGILTVIGPN